MLPPEHADKSTKYQLEAALRIVWRKFRNRLLLADNEFQFGDQIHHQLTVGAERLTERITPAVQLLFALRQDWTDEILKGLRECRIRFVSVFCIQLPLCKTA